VKKIFILVLFFWGVSLNFVLAKTIDEEIAEISRQIAEIEKAVSPLKSEFGTEN
jgi:hypothetical protein